MDDDTHEHLLDRAQRLEVSASQLVNRYVKEGLRMDEHPGITFVTTPDGHRPAVLASRPRLKVIDIVGTWKGERQDVAATARYFAISEDEVHVALRYYTAYQKELDQEIRRHLAAQQSYRRVLEQRQARARRRAANA